MWTISLVLPPSPSTRLPLKEGRRETGRVADTEDSAPLCVCVDWKQPMCLLSPSLSVPLYLYLTSSSPLTPLLSTPVLVLPFPPPPPPPPPPSTPSLPISLKGEWRAHEYGAMVWQNGLHPSLALGGGEQTDLQVIGIDSSPSLYCSVVQERDVDILYI